MNRAEYMRLYRAWSGIKARCNNHKDPAYKSYGGAGVILADEWYDFSNFRKWYEENYYEVEGGVHVDKDILGGNSYSSETCVLLPAKLNFQIPKKKRDASHVTGVQRVGSKFEVKVRNYLDGGKNEYIGHYDTEEVARDVYIKCKNIMLQASIDTYKGIVPESVFKLLKEYKYNG